MRDGWNKYLQGFENQLRGHKTGNRNRVLVAVRSRALAATNKMAHHNRMSQPSELGQYNIIAFVTIVDVSRAREFYRDTLGLRLVSEDPPFALVFEANGIMLRLGMAKELPPAHGTVLGWQVPEITATVQNLRRAGVHFERFEGMNQNELGIWNSPYGAKVAWFKDPDGNMLSVTEFPERSQVKL
ncbi:MAG: VOC family protein [Terracidiphilus sp.]